MANRIEAKYPGMFRIELYQDSATTGRMEATIFFNQKTFSKEGGVKLHSKLDGQGMGYENWAAFDDRLEKAVANAITQ